MKGSFYVYKKIGEKGVIDNSDISNIIKDNVIKIDKVEYFIVLHTLPGGASTVAFYLDQSKIEGIIGTIAGDDTILIITNNKETTEELFLTWMR